MKQIMSLPRTVPCDNCSGRTVLEFDRIDVGLEAGGVMHLSSVPYYQCRECDHRQMLSETRERLSEGIERFLAQEKLPANEVDVMLTWREMLSLNFSDSPQGQDRLYEVEWVRI